MQSSTGSSDTSEDGQVACSHPPHHGRRHYGDRRSPPQHGRHYRRCQNRTGRLHCADGTFVAGRSQLTKAVDVRRDSAIHTINDLQNDFFLEPALVVGGLMTLDTNLRDAAPKRAFLTSSAAKLLPALTSSNALDLIKHFGVVPNTHMATAVATSAYLGYGAPPGEKMSCVASIDAMAKFVSAKLGSEVHVLSTSNTPSFVPAVKAPVSIVDVAKGTVAEGEAIVVCHEACQWLVDSDLLFYPAVSMAKLE